jgi:fibro-slime domain-containing protein
MDWFQKATRGGANVVWLAAAIGLLGGCGDSGDGDASNSIGGSGGSGGASSEGGVYTDGGPQEGGNLDGSGASGPAQLVGTLRDFLDSHPDFEGNLGDDRGLVQHDLGADGKPVYAGGAGTGTTSGQSNFDQWYRDVPGVNTSTEFTIPLTNTGGNVYSYDNQAFFPIDGQLQGNEGRAHNYHFTFELHTRFTYKGGEVFQFTGDDDLFVFINKRLAMDLGGVHGPESAQADLDDLAQDLEIVVGNIYDLDFFFAERHTTQSTFRIDTTIDNFIPSVY